MSTECQTVEMDFLEPHPETHLLRQQLLGAEEQICDMQSKVGGCRPFSLSLSYLSPGLCENHLLGHRTELTKAVCPMAGDSTLGSRLPDVNSLPSLPLECTCSKPPSCFASHSVRN